MSGTQQSLPPLLLLPPPLHPAATMADYRLVVVEDCCADRDAEVHRMLVENVFARWTTVMKAEEGFPRVAP